MPEIEKTITFGYTKQRGNSWRFATENQRIEISHQRAPGSWPCICHLDAINN